MNVKAVQPKTTYFSGGKRGVILLHAYTGTPNDVRQLGRYLNNEDYSVLMPLLSGHGTPDAENILKANPSDWRAEVEHSLNQMIAEGFEEVAVFGLSLGGVLAFDLITKRSDVVIGGGSFCSPIVPNLKSSIEPTFIKYAEYLLKLRHAEETETAASISRVKNEIPKQLLGIRDISTEVFHQLENVTQPTFLAQAGQDELISAQQVFQTAEQLKNSAYTLNWYPKSSHVITVGPDKQQLQRDVLHYLETLNWKN